MVTTERPTVQNEAAAQAVLDAAKVRARQSPLMRYVVPLKGGDSISVFDCGPYNFLFGVRRLSFTDDQGFEFVPEDEAVVLVMLAWQPAVTEVLA